MKIVIDIPEEKYVEIKGYRYSLRALSTQTVIEKAIKNGKPLPKGHKVIDAYALQEHLALVPMEDRTYREAVEIIDRFPSIIEDDEESD